MKMKSVLLFSLSFTILTGCKKKPAVDITPSDLKIANALYFQKSDKKDSPNCLEYYSKGEVTSVEAIQKLVKSMVDLDGIDAVASCGPYKTKAIAGCTVEDKNAHKVLTGVAEGTTVTYVTYYLGQDKAAAEKACKKIAGAEFKLF